jgi:hypothetical protein
MELYCAIMSLWKLQSVYAFCKNVLPRRIYVPAKASGPLEFTCLYPLLSVTGRFQGAEQTNDILDLVVSPTPHNIG